MENIMCFLLCRKSPTASSPNSSGSPRFFPSRSLLNPDSPTKHGHALESGRIASDEEIHALHYSLVRPGYCKQQDDHDFEEGYGEYGRRPRPRWGLSQPFERQKRGARWKNKHARQSQQANKGEVLVHGNIDDDGGEASNGHEQSDPDAPNDGRAEYASGHGYKGKARVIKRTSIDFTTGVDHKPGGNGSDKTMEHKDDDPEKPAQDVEPNWWFGVRRKLREPVAEWLATLVLVLVGVCANLQITTSNNQAGSYTQSAAIWGLGTMMAVYIAGGISGGHCNPMISINLTLFRGFPFRKALIYMLAQTLGATCAVFIAFGLYKDAIVHSDPEFRSTPGGSGKAFFTLPGKFITPVTAFWTDFTAAAVLSGTILAIGDSSNCPPGSGMGAFLYGLVAFAISGCFGYTTGAQINPAKDLATRVVASIIGYGNAGWSNFWFVEAWAASIFGGLFGCLVYDAAIYEGPESPVNYPKNKKIVHVPREERDERDEVVGKKGWFSFRKKGKQAEDLEAANAYRNER